MTVIKAAHYVETETRLQRDPIVLALTVDLYHAPEHVMEGFVHEDGSPNFRFMQVVNAEYRKRGGTDGGHIGAIANAILANHKLMAEAEVKKA